MLVVDCDGVGREVRHDPSARLKNLLRIAEQVAEMAAAVVQRVQRCNHCRDEPVFGSRQKELFRIPFLTWHCRPTCGFTFPIQDLLGQKLHTTNDIRCGVQRNAAVAYGYADLTAHRRYVSRAVDHTRSRMPSGES
jgi:hypothetical protein